MRRYLCIVLEYFLFNADCTSLIPDRRKLAKFKLADFCLFASSWWPEATHPNLRILTFLMIWLFVWDDDMGQASGPLSIDLVAAQKYCEDSICYLEYCLGFWPMSEAVPVAPSVIVENFRESGEALCCLHRR